MSSTTTTVFDSLFSAAGVLPVPLWQALAKRESDLNPRARTGSARGLMQVTPQVVRDYNAHSIPAMAEADMFDPEKNIRVAAWLLAQIVDAYAAAGLPADWQSDDYVALVVVGWNAGWSAKAGVVFMLRWLKAHNAPPTVANVWRYAREAGASPNLSNATKQRWTASVVSLYRQYAGLQGAAAVPLPGRKPKESGKWNGMMIWGLMALLALSER